MNEIEYKQAIKEARRLGRQITHRMGVVETAQKELVVLEDHHRRLIEQIKRYEDTDPDTDA